ncbi:MAG: T9SS type A sorting domain-containing protein [Bacteroidetes bacterium]|nr:T9SS type A sorting domain-containing protein [Bacteroidota bacterium]
MKRLLYQIFVTLLFSSFLFSQRYAVTSGNWNDAIWANSSSGTAGEASTPTMNDNIIVNGGVTITISGNVSCASVGFGNATAKLALNDSATMTVFGNFVLVSVSDTAFSAWGTGAKIIFAGDSIQLLSGWSSSGFSTSFNYMLVNKTGGKVVTDGSNMRFGIGDTLEIVKGTFELASADDIESRSFSGKASSFVLLVREEGVFNMVGGASHIRRASNTTLEAKRIGKAVIFGQANFRTTSTNNINFSGIDVEAGGELVAASFSNSAPGNFNSGTINIKSGGELRVISGAPFWEPTTAVVNLEEGGVYRVNVADSKNAFPPTFNNKGTVRYGLTGDQIVKDMDYHNLQISYDGNKSLALSGNRTIADSLIVDNSATFVVKASDENTLLVKNVLRLTSGILNNDTVAVVKLGDSAVVSRATGVITSAPEFSNNVNLRYTSTVQRVRTGPEVPTAASIINNFEIAGSQGIELDADMSVQGSITLTNGSIFLNDKNLKLNAGGKILGSPSDSSMIVTNGTGEFRYGISESTELHFPIGDTANGSFIRPMKLFFTSGNFSSAVISARTIAGKHPRNKSTENYLNRYWNVLQQGITNFSCDAEFYFNGADVVGADSNFYLAQWKDSAWVTLNKVDAEKKLLSGMLTSFSDFTGAEQSGITEVQQNNPAIPQVFSLSQNYPNPFNPVTTIHYQLPAASYVLLKVYDIIGREVIILVNEFKTAGTYSVQWNASAVPSGVYVYSITADKFTSVKKMMLIK